MLLGRKGSSVPATPGMKGAARGETSTYLTETCCPERFFTRLASARIQPRMQEQRFKHTLFVYSKTITHMWKFGMWRSFVEYRKALILAFGTSEIWDLIRIVKVEGFCFSFN